SAETEARHIAASVPCVQVEPKGVSIALHYRNCPDQEATRELLLNELVPIAARYGARVLEGKRVFELVSDSLPDKASAVLNLCRRHELQGVVYLGDDIGDIAVFEAIRQRRESDGLPGLGLAVIDGETDPAVGAAADLSLAGVAVVEELLRELAS